MTGEEEMVKSNDQPCEAFQETPVQQLNDFKQLSVICVLKVEKNFIALLESPNALEILTSIIREKFDQAGVLLMT